MGRTGRRAARPHAGVSHPPSDPASVRPGKLGDTNGQGLNAFGSGWFAVDAAGRQLSGAGTGDTGGLGY